MALSTAERVEYVPQISDSELKPGLEFEYEVRAERGLFHGDFPGKYPLEPGKYPFELDGRWLIRAIIISQNRVGQRALFNVLPGVDEEPESLMTVEGIILPRTVDPFLAVGRIAEHPIEEGFSTLIKNPLINTRPPENGLRYVIPARGIHPGTLKIIGYPFTDDSS